MSIRLDPRRVNALKHLAGEAGMRPGDLVRQWVEERIDASRPGAEPVPVAPGQPTLLERIAQLDARIEALEHGNGASEPAVAENVEEPTPAPTPAPGPKGRAKRASAAPTERVALHDEMITVLAERGPMRAADLAEAIVERGRYRVPRSGKPLDGKTVSQRVSNPTYRSRFTRDGGLIGLAEG